jgi:hypothetical protein
VALRNQQKMKRRGRGNILDNHEQIVLEHLLRRDFTLYYTSENAIFHSDPPVRLDSYSIKRDILRNF